MNENGRIVAYIGVILGFGGLLYLACALSRYDTVFLTRDGLTISWRKLLVPIGIAVAGVVLGYAGVMVIGW